MRDDLGIYLKVLRSAMIELINEDYADFVNLSSNLVGLDQSIHSIQTPLTGLKDELLMIKETLQGIMLEVNECLERKRQLHEELKSIQSLTKVRRSIAKLEGILQNQLADVEKLDPMVLERAVLELIELRFDMQFCHSHFLRVDKIDGNAKCEELCEMLLSKIEKYFLTVLEKKNVDQLERCLRIYCILGECPAAEAIFRKAVVGPYLQPIVSEVALQNCPQGLNGIYKQILNFVDEKMKQLLALTEGRSSPIITMHVKGFDFLINSFWAEVDNRLETHMTSIFAPGNPDAFYQKYKCTNEFLKELEQICGTPERIERLRQHAQYKQFQTKWNLPVYFQVMLYLLDNEYIHFHEHITFLFFSKIRYQEIAGALETICNKPINKEFIDSSSPDFKLKPFTVAFANISKCWQEGVFLPQIFIKFFKLSLQMLSRISSWTDEVSDPKNWPTTCELKRIDFLVLLFLDVSALAKNVPKIIDIVVDNIPINLNPDIPLLSKCLKESEICVQSRLVTLQLQWQAEILSGISGWTKQVADIPRLYRKTNRDAPVKACNYVEQILRPAQTFHGQYSTSLDPVVVQTCLRNVFSQLTSQ